MKKIFLVVSILSLTLICSHSFAQMRGPMGEQQGTMKQPGMMRPMMPMMEKCQHMMMQTMMEMMNMQEKMIMGVKPSEKKQMMKDMTQMKEKMQKMMSMHMGMMMGMDESQPRLKCAEQWLKKAIDLHELHMKDPKTTTDASQMELMDQIKKAYGCITGPGPEMSTTPPKADESKETQKGEPAKPDPHKH